MSTKRYKKGKGGYLRYTNENRREKNKTRRMARHMARHPSDRQAADRRAGTPGAGKQRRAENIRRYEANAHKARSAA
jgi:hypothetical protein